MLNDSIQRVLELQDVFSADRTEAMLERNQLVKTLIPDRIRALLAESDLSNGLSANGSGGIGNNAIVPWARVFDPQHSPSAQSGWYVVFLFSADGSSVHLSLNLGVTKVSRSEIKILHEGAEKTLAEAGEDLSSKSQLTRQINLEAGANALAALYERGNLAAFTYDRGSVPDEPQIIDDLSYLLSLLKLVQEGRGGRSMLEVSEFHDELEALRRATYWSANRIGSVVESLFDESPQVIFAGPPGTGKTYVAQEIAKYIVHEDGQSESERDARVRLVQFHPSYGYEDFVEGLRPVAGKGGQIEFQTVPGVLLDMVSKINEDGKSRVLIIDEMNRANLPRVFGELMFLLEYREKSISLMLRDEFSLPVGLFIIGTMNTADRSIKNIDIALRRRFDFFVLDPDVEILRAFYSDRGVNEIGEALFEGFEALNREIIEDMGDSGYAVGHSYLMQPLIDGDMLRSIWDRQLKPLISDYFSDRPDTNVRYSFEAFWPSV